MAVTLNNVLKLRQFVTSNFCLKCDGCCRFNERNTIWSPRLLKEEEEKLGKKIRLLPNPKDENFTCAYFDTRNNRCQAYGFRPLECRLYPFLINRKDNKVFLALDLKCPYINKKLESQRYKKYIHYLSNIFRSQGAIKILKNNLKLIQAYPDVLNILELKI